MPYTEENSCASTNGTPISTSTAFSSGAMAGKMNHITKSLNPELLMREFTADEDGRLDSLNESPSSGFKSSFAREVCQNVRAGATDPGSSHETSSAHVTGHSVNNNSSRRSTSYLSAPKYRSQFAARHHSVRIFLFGAGDLLGF